MSEHFVSRGFVGKRREAGDLANRIPPGQHAVSDFPVLSAGPTPRTRLVKWTFTLEGLVRQSARWSWEEFLKLPAQDFVVDIHCVTKWTKLDTRWRGVSLDTLFEHVEIDRKAQYLTAFSDGGYTTTCRCRTPSTAGRSSPTATTASRSRGPVTILQPWLIDRGFVLYGQATDNHSPLLTLLLAALDRLPWSEVTAAKVTLLRAVRPPAR